MKKLTAKELSVKVEGLKKACGVSHHVALDVVAVKEGFANYKDMLSHGLDPHNPIDAALMSITNIVYNSREEERYLSLENQPPEGFKNV